MVKRTIFLLGLLCLLSNLNAQDNYTLLYKDIFIYGFDNTIDRFGSDKLLISNRAEIRSETSFGILGHGVYQSQDNDSWMMNEGQIPHILLTYNGETIPSGSKLEMILRVNRRGIIHKVEVFLDGMDISSAFKINLVGNSMDLSDSEATSLHLFSGRWYEKGGQSKLMGQIIDSIVLGNSGDKGGFTSNLNRSQGPTLEM